MVWMSGPLEGSDADDGAGVAWIVALVPVLLLGSEAWSVGFVVSDFLSSGLGGVSDDMGVVDARAVAV